MEKESEGLELQLVCPGVKSRAMIPPRCIDRALRAEQMPRERQPELTWPVPRYHLNRGVGVTVSQLKREVGMAEPFAGLDDTSIGTDVSILNS